MGTTALDLEGIAPPEAGTWEIDPAHTTVAFVARHLMVAKVRGHIRDFSGSIRITPTLEGSSAEVEMRVASIDTGVEGRDEHLRSADFLDVERHPTMTFRSTRVELTGGNAFRLDGDLTIRDVTRPVNLEVTYEGATDDPWGDRRAVFSARGEIDREEWGVNWNQALEAGGVVVGKKVKIEIEVEAVLRS